MNDRLQEIKKKLLECATLADMNSVNTLYDVEAEELLELARDEEISQHLQTVTGNGDWKPK